MQPKVAAKAPGIPAIFIPTKVARINGNRPRGHLGNGNEIRKFCHTQPSVVSDNLALDQGHGRISTAKAKQTNLKEAPKQFKIDHFFSLLFFNQCFNNADQSADQDHINDVYIKETGGRKSQHHNDHRHGIFYHGLPLPPFQKQRLRSLRLHRPACPPAVH